MFVIRSSRSAAHTVATLIALVILSAAAVADVQADLLQLNTAFPEALRQANASALPLVLDDRFTWTHTAGIAQTKPDLLDHSRLRAQHYADPRTHQETVH